MPDYRRYLVPGATYFFTVVTDGREPILCADFARQLLSSAIAECRKRLPFQVPAIVLLPEHIHTIWTLPEGDSDYSKRWGVIKKAFTTGYLAAGGAERPVSAGRIAQRRRGVWQPRFWEHMIRDETDYERHFNYIHFNPVKHGHSTSPAEWPWSSFQKWVEVGVYDKDWGKVPDASHTFAEIADTIGE
jgi:putative transposase